MGMFMTWKNEAFAKLSKSEYEGLLLFFDLHPIPTAAGEMLLVLLADL